MTLHPTDRELVAAHLGGDRAALGAIYDRYGDRLYDTAAAMLRDRDEAADVVQEVFLVAAQKLAQLRDPDRLKAWLFAVLRNEVYLRTRRRSRSRPTDFSTPGATEMPAPADPAAEGGAVELEELAELVRAAAAGLDERDQLVMELSVRQGLTGADLAAAVGVTTSQVHVLVHRMRDRLERSLGAFTVARMGRSDCEELASILGSWDGTFSVLIRKRVARHVERCEVCDETRSRFGAAALFGAAPVLAAPTDLRDAVLARTTRGETPRHGHRFDAEGFPRPPRATRPMGTTRSRLALTAAVLVVLAMIGIGLASDSGPDTDVQAAGADTAEGAPSTSGAPSSPSSGSPSSASPSTAVAGPPPGAESGPEPGPESGPESGPAPAGPAEDGADGTSSTSEPSTTGAPPAPGSSTTGDTVAPGDLRLSTAVVDLGESRTSGTLTLSNPGGQAVDWSLSGPVGGPFSWGSRAGTIQPGGSVRLTVSLDRTGLREGTLTDDFAVSGGRSGPAPVQVRARVERPPDVEITFAPSSLSCSSSTSSSVVAEVLDESAISSVVLRWSGPGNPGSTTMSQRGATSWEGVLSPDQVDGTWTITVVATDSRGNTASVSRPVVMSGCAGRRGGLTAPTR